MEYKVGDKVVILECEREFMGRPYNEMEIVTIHSIEGDDYFFKVLEDNGVALYNIAEIDDKKTLELNSRLFQASTNYAVSTSDLESCKIEPVKYTRENLAESLSSDNFKVDIWHTDDSFSVSFVDENQKEHIVIDIVERKYIQELIDVLQEALKL